ncbi:branched-chain amino acid ABC transporter permease [Bradyrhizobium sp. PRIMUS42]|uniref:branched-chain amino acid ABC transporter permease n=1 Tax=Bradyrhizobium sp. PRIMUS42 TaxID=2908926 RepID=UPI001FF4C60C|nr:branched-chain amino acid ABC transporter permease [Bradyrhizobium sp. PRIMUS42]MCJ9730228.1 branched-chain amino acid ABC transporter permease [Bradyrhizobium sp. PRIMUS42]
MDWVNGIVQGVLVGGLFALFATGLSLIFGVMRIVNVAHGDMIIASAYLAFTIIQLSGLHPLVSLLIVIPIASLVGYLLQTAILNRTLGNDILPPLLVTFGLSIIVQNGLLEVYSADSRRLAAGPIETGSFPLAHGIDIGYLPLLTFLTAVVVVAGLQFVFYRTELGRSFRAVSDDPETSQLMGLDNRKVNGLAMALCLAVVAIAGVFLATRSNFDPFMGPSRLIFGFEAVIIGGLGNLWGTLVGGVILGVAQAIGAQIDPGWQLLAGHIAFLVILAIRPQGLFPRGVR